MPDDLPAFPRFPTRTRARRTVREQFTFAVSRSRREELDAAVEWWRRYDRNASAAALIRWGLDLALGVLSGRLVVTLAPADDPNP